MKNLKCPECGQEIAEKTGFCSNCGFDLENDTIVCYECGTVLKKNTIVCINCGAPMAEDSETKTKESALKKWKNKIIGIGMIIAACVLFIVAFTKVRDESYIFYKEQYEKCEAGYEDAKAMANSSSGYFKSSYNNIADTYQEMMDDVMEEINEYRIQAIVCLGAGTVLAILGSIILKKGK